MASHFSQNSYDITSTWAITPFVPIPGLNEQRDGDNQRKEFSNTQQLDVAVQQENAVVMADPVSVVWPENAVRPEHQPPVLVEEQRLMLPPSHEQQQPPELDEEQGQQKKERGRRLSSAKIVAVSSVYFKFVKLPEDSMNQAALVLCNDVESSDYDVEDMAPGVNQEALLPFPDLLKGWKMETRQRPNGARDKFYSHPTSPRTFRSVIEVVDYIKSINKLEDAEQHEGRHNYVKLSEPSSSDKGKRKQKGFKFEDGSNFKITRSFPGDNAEKTPLQIELEEFFATAYNNLMNRLPPTPEAKTVEKKNKNHVAKKAEKKKNNQHISANAREKWLGGLREEGNGSKHQEVVDNQSREEIEEMINELQGIGPDIPQIECLPNLEPQNFQQGGINPEVPNPHCQAKSIDQRMIDDKMDELYQAAFGNPENLQDPVPPNFLQSGNQQLHRNP